MDTRSFSTRTEFREKENPKKEGTHIIGLDLGYSSPKCFHENGNFCFPNFCKKLKGELFGELNRNEIIYEDMESGERYYVGELATKSLRNDDVVTEDSLFGRNHYLHPDFLVVARTSLGIALWNTDTDGSDVFLQTGLPPAYIDQDEPYLRSVLQQTHHFAVTLGKVRKEFTITLTADQVDVMYQPMGTVYSIIFDANGKGIPNAREYLNSNLLVFDGGFGTLDTFFVRGKQLESKDTNGNLGMKRVIEEARRMISKEYGVNISIPAMQNCFKTGKFQQTNLINLKQTSHDVEPYLMKANALVQAEAFDSIKDYVFDIRYLIMSGGTGAAWYDYFKDRLSGITSLEVVKGNANSGLPVIYANARGYYMYRLKLLG
jgi:plasmid segregation protein ParM